MIYQSLFINITNTFDPKVKKYFFKILPIVSQKRYYCYRRGNLAQPFHVRTLFTHNCLPKFHFATTNDKTCRLEIIWRNTSFASPLNLQNYAFNLELESCKKLIYY